MIVKLRVLSKGIENNKMFRIFMLTYSPSSEL